MQTSFSYIFLFLSLPYFTAAQSLEWIVDYTGKTSYYAPQGWTISTQMEGDVAVWQAQESPGQKNSPGLLILAMNDPGLELEQITTSILQEVAQSLRIQNRIEQPNAVHLMLDASIEGIPASLATATLRNQGWVYLAMFAAPPGRFETLGGADVLYHSIQQANPYTLSDAKTRTHSGPLNMQDVQLQAQLLNQSSSLSEADLSGSWLQSFSMITGAEYLTNENTVRAEERGYAHLLEFKADRTYRITYHYQSYSAGCPYEAEVVETGAYTVDKNRLVLSNRSYQAHYNICGKSSEENGQHLASRTFMIGGNDHALVLRGEPFEYSISTETDSNGTAYIQEGFLRQAK